MDRQHEENNDEPVEPQSGDCCGEGCSSCVWDVYRDQLKRWQASQQQTNSTNVPSLSKSSFTPCTLISITTVTKDTAIYKFMIPNHNSAVPTLQPGQHLELRVIHKDEEIIRKYSPISWEGCYFEVIIKKYKGGKISQYLDTIREGCLLDWRGPYGNVNYRHNDQTFLLMLCVGTGVAPMIPIIRSIVEDPGDETVIQLLCGSRTLESRLLLKTLTEFAEYWNFSFVCFVTSADGEPGWGEVVQRYRISEDYIKQVIISKKAQDCKVYICGTDDFNRDMTDIVTKLGLQFYCF